MGKDINEARLEEGGTKLYFNGWFRVSVLLFAFGFCSISSYAYVIVMPRIVDNVVENDRLSRERDEDIKNDVLNNRVLIAELTQIREQLRSIKDTQTEFKQILIRTAPFERKQ